MLKIFILGVKHFWTLAAQSLLEHFCIQNQSCYTVCCWLVGLMSASETLPAYKLWHTVEMIHPL